VRHGEAVLSSASFIRESFLGGECAPTSSIFLRGDRRACQAGNLAQGVEDSQRHTQIQKLTKTHAY
jgi:hypothetical protein